ncbi:hypothetical protein QYF36_014129 [Acer negundo]|nr:hypothetical protein QYF36_014129 [Acer negundo]
MEFHHSTEKHKGKKSLRDLEGLDLFKELHQMESLHIYSTVASLKGQKASLHNLHTTNNADGDESAFTPSRRTDRPLKRRVAADLYEFLTFLAVDGCGADLFLGWCWSLTMGVVVGFGGDEGRLGFGDEV